MLPSFLFCFWAGVGKIDKNGRCRLWNMQILPVPYKKPLHFHIKGGII